MSSNNREPRRWLRRPRASTVIACVALFAALGGSATAASLINGKNIRKGTITGKQVKNRSLGVTDLSRRAVGSLRGAQGPQGPKGDPGAAGQPGAQGPPGKDGVIAPQTALAGSVNLLPNSVTTVIDKPVPAGTYLVSAKLNMFTNTDETVSCDIEAGAADLDEARLNPAAANTTTPMAMQGVANASPDQPLQIICSTPAGTTGNASDVKLTAIPVG